MEMIEREVIMSPPRGHDYISINGKLSPRRLSPQKEEFNFEFKLEEEEKVEVKKNENQNKKEEPIDYDNLTPEQELELRMKYEEKRTILIEKFSNFKKYEYTDKSIPIKKTIELHNTLVNFLKRKEKVNRYKGIIVGLFLVGEGAFKYFSKSDMLDGFTVSQEKLLDSYDTELYGLAHVKVKEEDEGKSNPYISLGIAVGTNTAFILVTLIASKLIGEKMGKSVVESIFKYFRPKKVKTEDVNMEEFLDGGDNDLISTLMSTSKLVNAGINVKNELSKGGGIVDNLINGVTNLGRAGRPVR